MTGYALSAGQPRTSSRRWINMKAREIAGGLEMVIVKGLPKEENFKSLGSLASTIAQKHKSSSFADA